MILCIESDQTTLLPIKAGDLKTTLTQTYDAVRPSCVMSLLSNELGAVSKEEKW